MFPWMGADLSCGIGALLPCTTGADLMVRLPTLHLHIYTICRTSQII